MAIKEFKEFNDFLDYFGYKISTDGADKKIVIAEDFSGTLPNKLQLIGVIISDNVKYIPNHMFSNCEHLEYAKIGKGLSQIPSGLFAGSHLKTIEMSESVRSIDTYAFTECRSLKKVNIPYGVKTIDIGAFSHNCSLKEVTIPISVKEKKDYSFFNCESLKSVTIPESVKSIGEYSFGYCIDSHKVYSIVSDFTIKGYKGSVAEKYAIDNKIPFETIG